MDEQKGGKRDLEWELQKYNNRFFDLMSEIDTINKKIKSLNGKIYRLQQQMKGRVEEYLEEHEGILVGPEAEELGGLHKDLVKAALAKYYEECL